MEMEMTMNGRSTLFYSVVDPGEASSSSTGFEDFLEMFGARHSSGDLFDLVRQGGACGGGSSMEAQPTSSRLSSSPPVTLPPSEGDMAAWLYPIVSSQERAVVACFEVHPSAIVVARHVVVVDDAVADLTRVRPPKTEDKCCGGAEDSTENGSGSRKKATGGGAKRSHPAEKHNLTEKRRRGKINEKFKTLQRLVPGCDDKSNQTSTLEQTIKHIKSLQQIQEILWFRCGGIKPPPALHPQVMPPPYVPPGTGGAAAGLMLPPAALAPAVLAMAREHVVGRPPEVVLAPASPPAAMAPFGLCLPLAHHAHNAAAAVMVHPSET